MARTPRVFWPMTSDKFVEDTPLVAAARRQHGRVLLALLHCGADPERLAEVRRDRRCGLRLGLRRTSLRCC